MSKKPMSEQYELAAIYEEKMLPLIKQLYETAKANNMPLMIHACHSLIDNGYTISSTVHFCGRERTPAEMLVTAKVLAADDILQASEICIDGARFMVQTASEMGAFDDDEDAAEPEAAEQPTTH